MSARRERRREKREARRGGGTPQASGAIAAHLAEGGRQLQAGRLDQAERILGEALSIAPQDPDANHLMGLVYHQAGRSDLAAPLLERAVKAAPKAAIIRVNLGVALEAIDRGDNAIRHYRKAIRHEPAYALAHNNLGHALRQKGQFLEALTAYQRALELQPDHVGAVRGLVHVLQRLRTVKHDANVAELLVQCLHSPFADAMALGGAVARQLCLKYGLTGTDDEADEAGEIGSRPPAEEILQGVDLDALAQDALAIAYFSECLNVAVPLEDLMRFARRGMLMSGETLSDDQRRLAASLARQGYISEYVAHADEDEWKRVDEVRTQLSASVSAGETGATIEEDLLRLAMYDEPAKIDGIDAMLAVPDLPQDIGDVLALTVANRRQEERLKGEIGSFSPIDDQVSREVRGQYEENPYPRWIRSPVRPPEPPAAYLKRLFPHFDPPDFLLKPDLSVLVAGAGTGSHPINVARDMPGARILTFDLSLSSLAYGIRMAGELGIDNISFRQGDILKADLLSGHGPFDMIQCIGVLHHMKDPLAGWRVLAGLLRKGGVFKIGLYSERARQSIVRARSAIADLGLDSAPRTIASFRRMILRGDVAGDFDDVIESRDFFSTSMVRDLLFHVQEHRYTPAQLDAEIRELGLEFLGFEPFDDPTVMEAYRAMFPDDVPMTDLQNWEAFEEKHPDAVPGYVFWCRKPA